MKEFIGLAILVVAPFALVPAVHAAAPEDPGVASQTQIEQALSAKPRTRGLRLRATGEEGKSGSVAGTPGESEGDGKIDLNIPFELNSTELKPQAVVQLEQLQSALKSAALADSRFLVAGHTDGRGNAQYNQQLSLRRAEAVKTYLVARGVEAQRLRAEGEGEDHLLTPADPENAVNRRVEIRNLGSAP